MPDPYRRTPILSHTHTAIRLHHLGALAGTVALALASRLYPLGFKLWDKSLGDALYTVAVYLVLALLLPRRSPALIAALALGFSVAVELLQLTGIPARYGHLILVRWLLGRGFAWHDIACYIVGVAAVATLDVLCFRARRADI
jgi:hypothetical protein